MNYFSKIKPVLNKLSELNVYDSLEVVRAYMQASADGNTNRAYVQWTITLMRVIIDGMKLLGPAGILYSRMWGNVGACGEQHSIGERTTKGDEKSQNQVYELLTSPGSCLMTWGAE